MTAQKVFSIHRRINRLQVRHTFVDQIHENVDVLPVLVCCASHHCGDDSGPPSTVTTFCQKVTHGFDEGVQLGLRIVNRMILRMIKEPHLVERIQPVESS